MIGWVGGSRFNTGDHKEGIKEETGDPPFPWGGGGGGASLSLNHMPIILSREGEERGGTCMHATPHSSAGHLPHSLPYSKGEELEREREGGGG